MEQAVAADAASPAVQNGSTLQHQQPDKVEEAVSPDAASPVAQNGALLQHQGPDNMEVPVVSLDAASHVPQNGALLQQGPDKVGEVVAMFAVSPAIQNGTPSMKSHDIVEAAVASATDSPAAVAHKGALSRAPQQQEQRAEEVRENGEAHSLDDAGVPLADCLEENNEVNGMAPVVAAPDIGGNVCANGSAYNIEEGAGLSVLKEGADNGDGRKMESVVGGGQLQRKEDGLGGRKKRWLTSATNLPPKRRAVSAVRKFPPGCGRDTVTTIGSGALDVSPVGGFPLGCGNEAVTTKDSGDVNEFLLEATTVNNNDASPDDPLAAIPVSGGTATPALELDASNKKLKGKKPVDQESSQAYNTIRDNIQPQTIVRKPSGFSEKMEGKSSFREGKQVTQVVDNKLRSDSGKMSVTLLDNADASREGKVRGKTLSLKKEVVLSNVNRKQDNFARKLKVDGIGKHTLNRSAKESYGKCVATNQVEQNDDMGFVPNQVIVQALMAPDRCPWRKGRKSIASASKSRAPTNKVKGKAATPKKQMPKKDASCELFKDEEIEDSDDSDVGDDDNPRALDLYEEKKELCITILPSVPSGSPNELAGDHDVDTQRKVRKLLQKFQGICRKLMRVEEQHLRNIGRIDMEAIKIIKNDPTYVKPGPIVGNVSGIKIGDEFHFRVELSLVGLHRPYQAGIDTSKVNGVLVAISIVASGGYPDELSGSDEMIYTGSGGKAVGNKEAEDQKLERGNLALKNCIETKTPVRVIHGFKGQSRGEVGHSKGKQVSTFTYDGLYTVVDCWQEGPKGSMVFKYKLQRIPGQPELSLHLVQVTRKSKVREGLCLPDISQGCERIPICVINTFDDTRPMPFKYITQIVYPPWYEKKPPKGCDCTKGCSDSVKCACAVRNGGEIPYNFNGGIVEAKDLIYECGPSCRCPPTCHNRVSQHGVKIPLEIFKTGKTGWGVRSLSSISSGTFICEYAGELLEDSEAEKRENDEYLFDIGSNYYDEELWEGLKSIISAKSPASSSETMEGYTIDAAECGNVGRFINHSCSPNLYAQNVLWDHDDMRMPRVMLYAAENIPPLQELTYHYNYEIGQVHKNGKEKVKHCYCGSPECCGRLY